MQADLTLVSLADKVAVLSLTLVRVVFQIFSVMYLAGVDEDEEGVTYKYVSKSVLTR